MRIQVIRLSYGKVQTIGRLMLLNENDGIINSYWTMELPWKNNQRNVSCIPENTYTAVKHQSPKFGDSLWLQDVAGRSEILVHPANYYHDLLGCIGVGNDLKDIDGDKMMDITDSRNAVNELIGSIEKNEIEIEIITQ